MLPLPRHRRDLALALGALAAITAPGSPAHAAPVIQLTDPANDDHGPGGYVHPSGRPYARGQYDLRRFEAEVVGDELVLRVTLDAPIRRPVEPRISGARTIALDNGVYVQNIDVYLDTTPGAGFTEGIPGRRISFAPADAWDHAIVLTPQPYKVRAVFEDWGRAGAHVSVPADVVNEGRTVIARVPLDRLGGPPAPHWGYAIAVSGARWDETLAVVDLLTDEARLDAYTLPVHTVAENEAFGGGALGAAHTQVIDVFTPPGLTQRDALAGRATLPMIRLDGRAPAAPAPAVAPAAAPAAAADAAIKDILDTTVVITGAPPTAPYRLAEVYAEDGRRVGKVVVTAIHPEFVTATIVEGLATIQRGMTVRFPEPAQDAEE